MKQQMKSVGSFVYIVMRETNGKPQQEQGNLPRKVVRQLAQRTRHQSEKATLSGSLGGEYSGDIKLELNGQELVGEVKYRDKSNFPSPFTVLEGRDIAFYKRRTGSPQTLIIMSGETFQQLMEKNNGKENQDSS